MVNLEVINYFIAAFLSLLSVVIILREYIRTKHRYYISMIFIWIILTIYLILGGVALLIQSISLYKWSDLLLIPFALLIIYVVDTINRGSVDPIKMLIFGISITGFIYALLRPDAIQLTYLQSGDPSYKNYGAYDIWTILFSLQVTIYYFIFSLLIFVKSPTSLKRRAFLTLIGGGFAGVIPFVVYITKLTIFIPGILMLSLAISAFITSLSFALEPRLLTVLISSAGKAKAKLLSNILPICAHCKDINDGEGNWHQIEKYFSNNSELIFSHGLCPDCQNEHYSEYLND